MMNKKTYTAPCAERIVFVPAETVSTGSGQWSWKWNWGGAEIGDNVVVSATGTNQLWSDVFDYDTNDNKPY